MAGRTKAFKSTSRFHHVLKVQRELTVLLQSDPGCISGSARSLDRGVMVRVVGSTKLCWLTYGTQEHVY
jgi:hypothetical protein